MNKIIVTIGPSSLDENSLQYLRKAGADTFRINLSHSNKELLPKYINNLIKTNLPISIDTQGPQLRVISFNINENITLGSDILLLFKTRENLNLYPENFIIFNHPETFDQIEIGDNLRVDVGGMVVRCDEILDRYIIKAKITSYASITRNRAVDIIDKSIKLDVLTPFDKYAIRYAYERGCKKVFASFVSSAKDAKEIRAYLPNDCELVSKIETLEGIHNINEIIDLSESILIDRGDLSRETSVSMIPIATNYIIDKCVKRSTPVYVATNVLDSMMQNSIPSRAEVSDIYNLLNASVSGLVLAAEVAIGKNPIKSVALLRYLMNSYLKYNNDYLTIEKEKKPPIDLIGEELFNWI